MVITVPWGMNGEMDGGWSSILILLVKMRKWGKIFQSLFLRFSNGLSQGKGDFILCAPLCSGWLTWRYLGYPSASLCLLLFLLYTQLLSLLLTLFLPLTHYIYVQGQVGISTSAWPMPLFCLSHALVQAASLVECSSHFLPAVLAVL
jgi:hypothetical protein